MPIIEDKMDKSEVITNYQRGEKRVKCFMAKIQMFKTGSVSIVWIQNLGFVSNCDIRICLTLSHLKVMGVDFLQ
jgi:hypothetical protein